MAMSGHTGPLEVESVPDRVYAVLRARIAASVLAPGSRVHQEDVARELAVSRTPVREAIGRLAAEGLVELLPNRGARVVESTLEDIEAAFSTRLVVEPGAARMAASRRLEQPLRDMDEAVRDLRAADRPVSHFLDANRRFHLALVRATGIEPLVRFMDQIWITRIGAVLYEPRTNLDQIRADLEAHAEIAAAIRSGHGATAEKLTRGHLERAMATLFSRP